MKYEILGLAMSVCLLTACGGQVDLGGRLTGVGDGGTGGGGGGGEGGGGGGGQSCSLPPATCTDVFPGATAFGTDTEAAEALVGRWVYCQGPPNYAEEYASDGTYYQLIEGDDGGFTRNLDPTLIGGWTVQLQPNHGIEVIIERSGGTSYNTGGLSTCPRSMVMGQQSATAIE